MINQLGSVPSVNNAGRFETVEVLSRCSDMLLSWLDDLVVEQRKFLWVGLLPQVVSKLISSSDVKKVLQ